MEERGVKRDKRASPSCLNKELPKILPDEPTCMGYLREQERTSTFLFFLEQSVPAS